MENLINATNENFDSLITGDKTTIVDFWAPWCGPCKMLGPVLDTLASENPDIQVVKVNVDENAEISTRFGIRSIPTVLIYKNGEVANKFLGFKNKEEILSLTK